MSEKLDRPKWYDELAVEHALAGIAFDELVTFVADTCLNAPERVNANKRIIEDSREPSDEVDLLRRLGLWGVRTAIEISNNAGQFDFMVKEPDEKPFEFLDADSAVLRPRGFSGEVGKRTQDTIEALGKSVLDEAFLCLGEDAWDKVQEFKGAENNSEQLKVIDWLLKRIANIRDKKEKQDEGNEQDDYFYHPIRLSPKFIGQFPDINLVPTCLGLSILVAAFVEKAGSIYFHAGVARTDSQAARMDYSICLSSIEDHASKWGVPLPDIVTEKINQIIADNRQTLRDDRGYHAAVMMRLKDGEWLQIDPNFHSNVWVKAEDINKELSETHETLSNLDSMLPGTEVMLKDKNDNISLFLEYLLFKSLHESHELKLIDEYLLTAEDVTMGGLADKFIAPVFFSETAGDIVKQVQEIVRDHLNNFENDEDESSAVGYIERTMSKTIEKYVFPDAEKYGLKACIERCRTDPAYRQRRVEDLKLAPLYFFMKVVGDSANNVITGKIRHQHAKMELGLPAYRIGASVLSDFAVYCGDELPSSFWLTYWPSHVAATEHIPTSDDSGLRAPLINLLGMLERSNLRYDKSYAIIKAYLEQEYEREGDGSGRK